MAKLVLPTVKSGYNLNQINNNFQTLVTELQNKVQYRNNPTGEPNQWETQQDANSQRLINLPDAVSPNEPVTLRQIGALISAVVPAGAVLTFNTVGSSGTVGNTVFNMNTLFGVTAVDVPELYIQGVHQIVSSNYAFTSNEVTLPSSIEDSDVIVFKVVV